MPCGQGRSAPRYRTRFREGTGGVGKLLGRRRTGGMAAREEPGREPRIQGPA